MCRSPKKYQLRPGITVVADDSILKGLKGWPMARDGGIKVHSFPEETTQHNTTQHNTLTST